MLLQIGPFRTATDPGVFDAGVNREAVGIAEIVRRKRLTGVRDAIPTYRSVAVFFDPLKAAVDDLKAMLESCEPPVENIRTETRAIDVPVVYGGVYGF